eukprot:1160381-Pelagomonas_calceolata.AAC.16
MASCNWETFLSGADHTDQADGSFFALAKHPRLGCNHALADANAGWHHARGPPVGGCGRLRGPIHAPAAPTRRRPATAALLHYQPNSGLNSSNRAPAKQWPGRLPAAGC